MPVIDVENLHKRYRDGLLRGRRIDALRGVSLSVDRGEIFGLLGPNGAGKTTLIKVLLGIVRLSGGRANLLGLPAGSRQARKNVGYLPENHRIPRHHTANSALAFFVRLVAFPRLRFGIDGRRFWRPSDWPTGDVRPFASFPRGCSNAWGWRRRCCTILSC